MGFESLNGTGPARVVLEQVTDRHFRLLEGFRYVDRQGLAHEVRPDDLKCTDLASVPRAFRWFVGRHGRHTLAAMLHDHEVTRLPGESRRNYGNRRTSADDRFLEMLAALGVPWIQRSLMWGAVHAATRFLHHVWLARLALVAWIAAAGFGMWNLVAGVVAGDWQKAAWALAAPLAGALLWTLPSKQPRKRWWCGVVVSYGVLLFVPALMINGIALTVNALLDLVTGGQGPSPWQNPDNCPD